MNYLFEFTIFTAIFFQVNGVLYERFNAKKVEDVRAKELRLKNILNSCTIDIKPCVPHEGSRINGTCNNYKYPAAGAAKGPYTRLMKPDYSKDGGIRAAANGEPLPSARKVRTALQSSGRVEDKSDFNVAAAHFMEFINKDISAIKGPFDYLKKRPHCCDPEATKDARCIPIKVPEDDPYLKLTDIRCLNFSRAETFQDAGCTTDAIPPEQINYQTPVLDLSTIYGVDEKALDSVRKYERGLLKMEKRGTRYVPLSDQTSDACFGNEGNETVCYQFGFPEVGNIDLRTTTFAIFFMREHNRLAKALHKINPCWKDDRLFKVARQINIATASNIYMYELMTLLFGYKNMVNFGLISERVEEVTVYDEEALPLVYAEYEIASRFYHTFLDGRIKKYDEKHHYAGELSLSETLFRQDLIEQNANFEEINRGTFYQNAAKIDDIQDPEISENFFAKLQKAHDLIAADIQRGRDMGIRGYNDYRNLCGLKRAKDFGDFSDIMDFEKVELLKKLYNNVDDVDLLAGIMSENFIDETLVTPTLFCIMGKQLTLFRFADRFWYERGEQFHSFSHDQLHEIRKTNMARFACDNVEAIKYIQPEAFLNVDPRNTPVPCAHIPGIDLSMWRDDSCRKHKYNYKIDHGLGKRKNYQSDYVGFFDNMFSYKPSDEDKRW
ncbi:salivary peroxidase/catechol oxidase-like [Epargyreus clarus]|uniref:salivary peroxidase/catechol oxidase-like n=1 Tax=Epargyreus clarus TaxID=520877 RepID=UPI003C2CD8EC